NRTSPRSVGCVFKQPRPNADQAASRRHLRMSASAEAAVRHYPSNWEIFAGLSRPGTEKRSQEMSGAKTGQAGQCERPRGTEHGSRLLKDRMLTPAESIKNV